jgi:hypothetical protein
MPLAIDAATRSRRPGPRSPVQLVRDLATLVGAALTVGVAVGAGMMLTVLLLS